MGQIPMVQSLLWICGLLCHFCLKGQGFLKGYSWFSIYVLIAHHTQGWFFDGELGYFRPFWEAANGVAVVYVSLLGGRCRCNFSDVVLFYCEGVVLGWGLG